ASRSRARTVGSSPYPSSPTGASAMARRIRSVGWVNESLRSSIMGALRWLVRPAASHTAVIPCVATPGAHPRRGCAPGGPARSALADQQRLADLAQVAVGVAQGGVGDAEPVGGQVGPAGQV